ncbi:Uncharacterised protein [Mycobacteroides abscessus subsp. abscessus]|nr:Uncharacterised protein [Mycobacteroides abscessus subsp. abscessus]
MLVAVTETSICPGAGATRSKATKPSDCRSPGVRTSKRTPSLFGVATVLRQSSGPSGPRFRRARYQ